MSSLSAARADNFYHPPDWDPRKQSRADFSNAGGPAWKAHPLRERAKKISEGILTIRFEMPFNVRCTGCGNQIGKGVRFNAEKKCVGKYLSTKIWSFRMMCHCEDGTSRTDRRKNPHFIEVHTDPKNAEYIVVEGAEKVPEPGFEEALELGVEATVDPEEAARRASDPFYRLEALAAKPSAGVPSTGRLGEVQALKPKQQGKWLAALQADRDDLWQDDYAASQMLRRLHRHERKEHFFEVAGNEAKGIRISLGPEEPEDIALARSLPLQGKRRRHTLGGGEANCGELRRVEMLGESIFADGGESEAKRLKLLQLRKRRGMQITATTPGKSRAAASAPRHKALSEPHPRTAPLNLPKPRHVEALVNSAAQLKACCAKPQLHNPPMPYATAQQSGLVDYSDSESDAEAAEAS